MSINPSPRLLRKLPRPRVTENVLTALEKLVMLLNAELSSLDIINTKLPASDLLRAVRYLTTHNQRARERLLLTTWARAVKRPNS